MIDLREHRHELADAAARHGTVPARRPRSAAAGSAGGASSGWWRPSWPSSWPWAPASPAGWSDSGTCLQMEPEVRRCPGGLAKRGNLIGYFRSPEYRRLVMIGGKPLRPGRPR
jgi:hypothetical protein